MAWKLRIDGTPEEGNQVEWAALHRKVRAVWKREQAKLPLGIGERKKPRTKP
jgi:hypothetical protein